MMKNKFKYAVIAGLAGLTPLANASDIITNTAHLQAMDKITGKVSEIDVPINGLANFGTFSILVRKCVTKSPEETPENTAFVDIVDNYQTENPVNIFKGWMFSSTPALNAVEHPIYDIWLLKCYNSDASKHKTLSKEQLALRDTLPMKRPEPIEVSTTITTPDDTNNEQIVAPINEQELSQNTEDKKIVNLDKESIATASDIQPEETDNSFVSEGEEDENFDDNKEQPETETNLPTPLENTAE